MKDDIAALVPTIYLFRYKDTWQPSPIVHRMDGKPITIYESYLVETDSHTSDGKNSAIKKLQDIYHFHIMSSSSKENACMFCLTATV